jgi:hypothetical protein
MIAMGLLWRRWVLANSLGELVGLGLTFAIGIGLFSGLAEAPGLSAALLSAALMTITGALEGAIVGTAQWLVLKKAFVTLSRSTWVWATIIGAVLAWGAGSIPMILASSSPESAAAAAPEPPQSLMLAMASGIGLVAGAVLSAAQAVVLRKHVTRAWRWLPANAVAWAVGMPLIFGAIDLAQLVGKPWASVLVLAGAIALVGALVGAIHGLVVVSFAAEDAAQRSPTTR